LKNKPKKMKIYLANISKTPGQPGQTLGFAQLDKLMSKIREEILSGKPLQFMVSELEISGAFGEDSTKAHKLTMEPLEKTPNAKVHKEGDFSKTPEPASND
jgi:hypothetical protein